MPSYAVLHNPGHNRVYFNAARTLAVIELTAAAKRFSVSISDIREREMGGVRYTVFDADAPLTGQDLTRLSRLSFTYAIFESDGGRLLPLTRDGSYYFDDGLSAYLKYAGKTNELFTRMMLNIAVCAGAFDYGDGLRVLDPVCGKGTTLFEALTLGFNACGVELDEKLAREAYTFFKKYLETGKYKHSAHTERTGGVDGGGKKFTATRYAFELAKNKTGQQAGLTLNAEFIAGDTRHMNAYYKKNSFHLIVGDLPYGVQHGSGGANQKRGGMTRSAAALLAEALPEWLKTLKPGGAVALAWNLYLIPRAEMEKFFGDNGLNMPEYELYTRFPHRVEQAITRDVIVGVKP